MKNRILNPHHLPDPREPIHNFLTHSRLTILYDMVEWTVKICSHIDHRRQPAVFDQYDR